MLPEKDAHSRVAAIPAPVLFEEGLADGYSARPHPCLWVSQPEKGVYDRVAAIPAPVFVVRS